MYITNALGVTTAHDLKPEAETTGTVSLDRALEGTVDRGRNVPKDHHTSPPTHHLPKQRLGLDPCLCLIIDSGPWSGHPPLRLLYVTYHMS